MQELDLEFDGNSITCKAKDIFPAPTLTWSTDPLTDAGLLEPKTKTLENTLGFYDIQSSLWLSGNNTVNQTYTCSVASGAIRKTASIKQEGTVGIIGRKVYS